MSVVAKVLVVDVGNTSVKYTAFEGDSVLWQHRDVGLLSDSGFVPEAIYFVSVRSVADSQFVLEQVSEYFSAAQIVEIHSEAQACGVRNAYEEPHRLGVDRWLTVVASYHLWGGDVVVIDAGTAIKVDMVDTRGQHLGGYIAPGLALMENSLLANTARIRYVEEEKQPGVGLPNSTARAVSEGCNEMALGFLERVYQRYGHFNWVITGGDAAVLLSELGIVAQQEEHLLARGAKLVGDAHLGGLV